MVAAGIDVLRQAARTFRRHRAQRLSAGLAYHSLFAFIPTVFIATAIGAAFFGEQATEGRLADRLDDVVGIALVYYSARVLLYGAEVVRACADHRGRPMRPTFEKTGDQ